MTGKLTVHRLMMADTQERRMNLGRLILKMNLNSSQSTEGFTKIELYYECMLKWS